MLINSLASKHDNMLYHASYSKLAIQLLAMVIKQKVDLHPKSGHCVNRQSSGSFLILLLIWHYFTLMLY